MAITIVIVLKDDRNVYKLNANNKITIASVIQYLPGSNSFVYVNSFSSYNSLWGKYYFTGEIQETEIISPRSHS